MIKRIVYERGGRLLKPTSELEQIDTTPAISEEEAVNICKQDIKMPLDAEGWPEEAELNIYAVSQGRYRLAYKINLESWEFFVDAMNGAILDKESSIRH